MLDVSYGSHTRSDCFSSSTEIWFAVECYKLVVSMKFWSLFDKTLLEKLYNQLGS